MIEFWHDLLHDKDTFLVTIWVLFCAVSLGIFTYKMSKI